jgi:threonine dehydrogenase-like Zn-dependent dehydrogenase
MPDQKYDVVVEATGSISGFQFCMDHVRPRGTVVLKSTLAASPKIDLAPVVVGEITLIGSRCGRFGPALDYLAAGKDLAPLITGTYSIDNGLEAFAAAKAPGSLKVIVGLGG